MILSYKKWDNFTDDDDESDGGAPAPAPSAASRRAGGFVDMRTDEALAPKAGLESCGGFRSLRVPDPPATHVLGCCACCAVLLKMTADAGNSRNPDRLGVFWAARPGPTAEACPADVFLHAVGSEARFPVHGGLVGVCLWCAQELRADEAAHVARCRRWLDVRRDANADLNPMRRRERAAVLLFADPDVSRGLDAPAGLFARGNRAGSAVPYAEAGLEGLAFPTLGFTDGNGWWPRDGHLRAYTFLRLYSADPRWRRDPDYVAFAVQRAAAAGDAQFRHFAASQLPAAVPASRLPGEPDRHAHFWRYDEASPIAA